MGARQPARRPECARLTRRNVKFPPSIYNRIGTAYSAGAAAAVRVTIDRATGNLSIAKAYCPAP